MHAACVAGALEFFSALEAGLPVSWLCIDGLSVTLCASCRIEWLRLEAQVPLVLLSCHSSLQQSAQLSRFIS